MFDYLRQNSILIMFILFILLFGISWKTWNDRYSVSVGNKITEKIKDVLLDSNCKIEGSNVKCRGDNSFADLGNSFTVQEAVDNAVKYFLKDIDVSQGGVGGNSRNMGIPQPQTQPIQGHGHLMGNDRGDDRGALLDNQQRGGKQGGGPRQLPPELQPIETRGNSMNMTNQIGAPAYNPDHF